MHFCKVCLTTHLPELLRRYPHADRLEALLAAHHGVNPAQVLVTAGGDDALDRICRAVLTTGREMIFPTPSFEMLARYAILSGATVVEVPWRTPAYPLADVLCAVGEKTAVIAVVSPNNPTGGVATAEDLHRLAAAAPRALILLDHAYAEFSFDLTAVALRLGNAVVVRTLSKAWGLAGLRVGYVLGPQEFIGWLRVTGAPYSVSGLSLALAEARLATGAVDMQHFVARVSTERAALFALLQELGQEPFPSHANFILCRFRNAHWVHDALAGLGIAVRRFTSPAVLADCLRITCPGQDQEFARLRAALLAVLRPARLYLARGARALCSDEQLQRLAARLPVTAPPPIAGGEPAWLVGSTPEEIKSGRRLGAVPLGLGESPAPELTAAGAARVFPALTALEALWP